MLGANRRALGLFCARFALATIEIFGASHIPLHSRISIDAPVLVCALALAGHYNTAVWIPARRGGWLREGRGTYCAQAVRKLQDRARESYSRAWWRQK